MPDDTTFAAENLVLSEVSTLIRFSNGENSKSTLDATLVRRQFRAALNVLIHLAHFAFQLD